MDKVGIIKVWGAYLGNSYDENQEDWVPQFATDDPIILEQKQEEWIKANQGNPLWSGSYRVQEIYCFYGNIEPSICEANVKAVSLSA